MIPNDLAMITVNLKKSLLSSDLLLPHFDLAQKIVVAVDVSKYGVGSIISNLFANGTEKAITQAFRSLIPTERSCIDFCRKKVS